MITDTGIIHVFVLLSSKCDKLNTILFMVAIVEVMGENHLF